MEEVLTSLAMFASLYELRVDNHDARASQLEEASRSGRDVVLASLPPQSEDDHHLEMYLASSRGTRDAENAALVRTHYEWLCATVRATTGSRPAGQSLLVEFALPDGSDGQELFLIGEPMRAGDPTRSDDGPRRG